MKRTVSIILILVMAITIYIPMTAEHSYGASVRTTMPGLDSAEGKTYYYNKNNPFYAANLGGTNYSSNYKQYVIGNCTWYAYARASEMNGKWINSNFRWSASKWWDINKQNRYYPYGSTPKVGAIACYSNHVAVVEKVVNGKPYVSESGWKLSSSKPTSASQLYFHYGTPWYSSPKGYIYVSDASSNDSVDVSYNVKVTTRNLNMRTGPGTSYKTCGYIKPGTYAITQESNGWGKLSSNGYWIALKYATKVSSGSDSGSVDTGTAVSYNVKISVSNLNMRTGPSTSYASKGYVKPGIYTITKESNGWGRLSSNGYWVALKYTSKTSSSSDNGNSSSGTLYKVKVTASALNMRTGPGTSYSSRGKAVKGAIFDIVDTKDGWGQISTTGAWIKLSYTVAVNAEYNVKITAKDLNMRSGPGILYARKGYIKPGTYTIKATNGDWGQLKSNGYWIKLSYTTKI